MKNPPAFPTKRNVHDPRTTNARALFSATAAAGFVTEEGMTLRDYFAAHAPNEIPVWFQAKLTPLPERHKDAKFCNGCLTEFQDCEQTISCLKAHEHKNLENKIRDIQKMERMIQWRFTYADAMLNERERGEK